MRHDVPGPYHEHPDLRPQCCLPLSSVLPLSVILHASRSSCAARAVLELACFVDVSKVWLDFAIKNAIVSVASSGLLPACAF